MGCKGGGGGGKAPRKYLSFGPPAPLIRCCYGKDKNKE